MSHSITGPRRKTWRLPALATSLTAWARTYHHEHTAAERAARLLWSDKVHALSDAELDELGRVLGLPEEVLT